MGDPAAPGETAGAGEGVMYGKTIFQRQKSSLSLRSYNPRQLLLEFIELRGVTLAEAIEEATKTTPPEAE